MFEVIKGLTALILVLGVIMASYYASIAIGILVFVIGISSFAIFILYCIWDWVRETLFESKDRGPH